MMDFEDFVYNRTDGLPQSVKALGDAGKYYVSNYDDELSEVRNC